MRKIFLVLITLTFTIIGYSQVESSIYITNEMLSDPKTKTIYFALPNIIKIHGIENSIRCKVLFSQCRSTKQEGCQLYTIYPTSWEENVFLTIKDTISNKVIYVDTLKTITYPDPYLNVSGRRKGEITKEELQHLENLEVIVDKVLWKYKVYVISEFTVSSSNDDLEFISQGQYLTSEQKKYLLKLPSKTKIYFGDVRVQQLGTKYVRNLMPVKLEIK